MLNLMNEGPRAPKTSFPKRENAIEVNWCGYGNAQDQKIDRRLRDLFSRDIGTRVAPYMMAGNWTPPAVISDLVERYLTVDLGAVAEIVVADSDPDQIILDVNLEGYPRGLRIVLWRPVGVMS